MKLTAYIIGGNPVGTVVKSWEDADLGGNPAFKFESTVSTGYEDITSVENINDYGFNLDGYDYKRVRDYLKTEVETIGWTNLTATQKTIAATHKIGTHAERLAAFGGDVNTLVAAGTQYHVKVFGCRQIRMAWAESCVHNHLEHLTEGSQTVPEFILSNIPANYISHYVNNGRGGVCDNDSDPGLLDYINNTVGTIHADAGSDPGLRTRTWTPEGLADMSAFCDKLMDILQKGIY